MNATNPPSGDEQSGAVASAILAAALDCVITIDHEGRVLDFNPAAERTFGYRRDEVLGREMADLIVPPELRQRHRRGLARYLATGETTILDHRVEFDGLHANGTRFPVELSVIRIPDSEPARFAGYIRDIGDRRRAARELELALERERDARADAERRRFGARRLVAQALGAEESERRRLAQALHDGAVQELLAAQFELRSAASGSSSPPEAPLEAIARAVAQLREAITELYPPVLEHGGLEAALDELGSTISTRYGLEVSVEVAVPPSSTHEPLLYSLARELLLNAARHAEASEVTIRVLGRAGEVVLEVEDSGIGLTQERREQARREGHIGLASSEERVEALGGRFQTGPGATGGTLVQVRMPARRGSDREPQDRAVRDLGSPRFRVPGERRSPTR